MEPIGYWCRITRPEAVVRLMIAQFSSKVDRISAWLHEPEHNEPNIHCHLVLLGVSVTLTQIKNLCKKIDPRLKGNGDWAFDPYDHKQNPYIYASKGTIDPFYTQNEDENWIMEQKKLWVEQPAVLDSWALRWIDFQRVAPKPYKSDAVTVHWDDKRHPFWKHHEGEDLGVMKTYYLKYPNEIPIPVVLDGERITFDEVVKAVYSYVWQINGGVQRPQAKLQRSCLIDTYCYHHKIPVPPGNFQK